MLTQEEYKLAKKEHRICPFGRSTEVGDVRCINCYFFQRSKEMCAGDRKSVQKHMDKLKLDY